MFIGTARIASSATELIFAHSAISDFVIGREAFEISVSPRQNFLNPPPVPEMPTVTLTAPRLAFWNSSATASVMRKTVLEPSNQERVRAQPSRSVRPSRRADWPVLAYGRPCRERRPDRRTATQSAPGGGRRVRPASATSARAVARRPHLIVVSLPPVGSDAPAGSEPLRTSM